MNPKTGSYRRAVFFIIIFLLLFSLLEMKARSMYQTQTDLSFQHECFEKIKDKVELLFLGTSQMQYSINSEYISKKSFNLAFLGADLYYNYMRLKKCINEIPLLSEVVIEIPFFYFGYDQGKHYLMPYAKDYLWVLGILPKPVHIVDFLYKYNTILLHQETFFRDLIVGRKPTPLLIMSGNHIPESTIINAPIVLLENGFRHLSGALANEESEKEKQGEELAWTHSTLFDESIVSENIDYLTKIINLATEKKIKITLLTLPSTIYYRKNLKKEFIDSFSSNIRSILDKYPEVTYYNFSTVETLTDDDFYDPSHMNHKGAKKFSMMMNSILCKTTDDKMISMQ